MREYTKETRSSLPELCEAEIIVYKAISTESDQDGSMDLVNHVANQTQLTELQVRAALLLLWQKKVDLQQRDHRHRNGVNCDWTLPALKKNPPCGISAKGRVSFILPLYAGPSVAASCLRSVPR